MYNLFADIIAIIHILFVFFVMFGVLLALRWPGVVWAHAPAVVWGLIVEFAGLVCPLTPLENRLRAVSGEAGYTEDFVSHWLTAVLYPNFLTRNLQIVLGGSLLLLNISLYAYVWKKKSDRRAMKMIGCTGKPAGLHR